MKQPDCSSNERADVNISDWRPMAHWNGALGLSLADDGIESLANWCEVIATDGRFEAIEGYAATWKNGMCERIFSPTLVLTFIKVIGMVPDRPEKFLAATRRITHISQPTVSGSNYCEEENVVLDSLKMTSRQRQYALNVYSAFGKVFGYACFYDKHHAEHCDPGLIVTAGRIARARHPRQEERRKPRD